MTQTQAPPRALDRTGAICPASGAPIPADRTDGNGVATCPHPGCGRLVVTDARDRSQLHLTRTIRAHRPLERHPIALAIPDTVADTLALADVEALIGEVAQAARLLAAEANAAGERGDDRVLVLVQQAAANLGTRLTALGVGLMFSRAALRSAMHDAPAEDDVRIDEILDEIAEGAR